MKTLATLLLLSLLLVCTGCGTIGIIEMKLLPTDDIYGIVSLRDLAVGHVINVTDVSTAIVVGHSHRELLHPFTPYSSTELTTDDSKIVGHMVKTFIPERRVISPQRDLI